MSRSAPDTKQALIQMRHFVQELNADPATWGKPEVHPKLVQLLQAWQESTEKWRALVRAWKASGSPEDTIPPPVNIETPEGCPPMFEITNRCTVLLSPNPSGGRWFPGVAYSPGKPWTTWDFVCSKFVHVVLNPECHRFGGPCPLCGNFFIRTTAKERRYCSKECAHKAAAKASTQRHRAQEHTRKVGSVRKAIEQWRPSSRKTDWISWVQSQVPEISKAWLTRAINRNEITIPPRGCRVYSNGYN